MKSMEDQVLPSTAPTVPQVPRGWSQSDRIRVAGLQGGRSKDKPLVLLFVVEDCSRS